MKNFLIFILIAIILVLLRLPFLDEPFERDEGGYAYMGQCLLEGKILYKDVWEHMPPGLPFMYALIFKLYGVNFYSVRIFSIFWALIGLLFLYLLTEALYGKKTALLSSLLYAVFSGGPIIQGSSSNTEPFMIVFLIIGLYFFFLSEKRKDNVFLLFAGMAIGLGTVIKQPAFMNLIALILFLLIYNRSKLIIFIIGASIPWIPFVWYFTKYDLWQKFFYALFIWNFTSGQHVFAEGVFYRFYRSFLYIARENSILWFLSITAIVYILISRRTRENMLILFWSIFSFFGVCLGGMFYPHYYIQMIPALAILSGYSLCQMKEISKIFVVVTIVLLLVFTVCFEYKYFFVYSPDEVCAAKYGSGIFVFTRDLAKYIEGETKPDDTIFVWGLEPEIYFYSQRKCPSRFIHNYSIRGEDRFGCEGRRELMQDIIREKPVFIVPTYTLDMFPELREYIEENYLEAKWRGLTLYKRNE